MRNGAQKLARFLVLAAFALFAGLLLLTAVSALCCTASSVVAENPLNQRVTVERDRLLPGIALTALMLLALILVHRLSDRRAGKRSCAAIALIWMALAVCFVLAVGLVPLADSNMIIDAASRFAKGDYGPLDNVYFHRVSYQLGVCLPMELLARLLPGLELSLVMQVVNCLLSALAALMLCRLAAMLYGDARAAKAAMLLYLAFVPMLLFNMFVYSVLPMFVLCVSALYCFARYTQTRRRVFGLCYAVLIGMAAMVKPNAMIVMLALAICAVIDALAERDGFVLLCAVLSAVLCVALPAGVIRIYELRSGVTLAADTGMLLRLAMGMQDSVIAAGWYNGVIEEYWDLAVTPQMEKAAALEMLSTRMGEFMQNPSAALDFVTEKFLTQWAEPSYDTLWWGAVCPKGGRFNGMAHMLFRDESPVRALLEDYMNIFQQAAYLLALLGTIGIIREKKTGAAQMMLPLTILGGFFYHMIFEAKSQYILPYMLLMLPLAARGLSMLSGKLEGLVQSAHAGKKKG